MLVLGLLTATSAVLVLVFVEPGVRRQSGKLPRGSQTVDGEQADLSDGADPEENTPRVRHGLRGASATRARLKTCRIQFIIRCQHQLRCHCTACTRVSPLCDHVMEPARNKVSRAAQLVHRTLASALCSPYAAAAILVWMMFADQVCPQVSHIESYDEAHGPAPTVRCERCTPSSHLHLVIIAGKVACRVKLAWRTRPRQL